MAQVEQQFKVTGQDATTVTLQPLVGGRKTGLSDQISQIVLTFASARDTQFFDIINRVFAIEIEKK